MAEPEAAAISHIRFDELDTFHSVDDELNDSVQWDGANQFNGQ
jgi:hypothetical protein